MSESVSYAAASVSYAAAPSRRRYLLRGMFAALAAVLALGGAAATAHAEPQVAASANGNYSFIWG